MLANERVFVKNELTVTAQISVTGYVNREIPVRLLFENTSGNMEVVGQQKMQATSDGQLLPVSFTYIPQDAGEYKVTVEAELQPGEMVKTNNQLSTFVEVLKGGLSVLYIEGAVRVEQKFIAWALAASRDIKVDCLRLTPRPKRQPPGRPAELFQRGKYEVYILGDVDSTAFTQSRTGGAGRNGQPWGGTDHAGRIPELRARRLLQHAAGRRAAGGHGRARTGSGRTIRCARTCTCPARCGCGPRPSASGISP